jgi:chemotaxis protein MotB
MRRRRTEVQAEDHDRWLISYADFITLLFGFFVVMYAVSSVNEGKYRVVSESLEAAFRTPQRSLEPVQVGRLARSPYRDEVSIREVPTATIPLAIPLLVEPIRIAGKARERQATATEASLCETAAIDSPPSCYSSPASNHKAMSPLTIERWQFPEEPELLLPDSALSKATDELGDDELSVYIGEPETSQDFARSEASRIAEQLSTALPRLLETGAVSIRYGREAAEIEIGSGLLFESASAGLDQEAMPILSQVAEALRHLDNEIRVEGFTDNRPIKTLAYPSNWELSAARAASVVHQFSRLGLDPQRMAAVGYGEHQPVASNDTQHGRKRNRRVLILVLARDEASMDEIVSMAPHSGAGSS